MYLDKLGRKSKIAFAITSFTILLHQVFVYIHMKDYEDGYTIINWVKSCYFIGECILIGYALIALVGYGVYLFTLLDE